MEEPEPNKTEIKWSAPNWNIYILIFNLLFSPFNFWLLMFNFCLSTFVFYLLTYNFQLWIFNFGF